MKWATIKQGGIRGDVGDEQMQTNSQRRFTSLQMKNFHGAQSFAQQEAYGVGGCGPKGL